MEGTGTYKHTGRKPYEKGGRDYSDAAASQGTSRLASNQQEKLGEVMERILHSERNQPRQKEPTAKKNQPRQNLDYIHIASIIVRK